MSMIHYISLHVESARAALKELLRQPIGTLLTLLMLAVAMTLPLFMYLVSKADKAYWANSTNRRKLRFIWTPMRQVLMPIR